jgi:homoserine kinase type II
MQSSREYLTPHLNSEDQQLLESELSTYQAAQPEFDKLPRGIIHADLFRDNALFHGDELTGVIDFYNACSGPLLYDLAVVANDWCRSQCKPDPALTTSFLHAYQLERRLERGERDAWPLMLRFAACRFWISRLLGCYPVSPDRPSKDPMEFRQILIQRLESSDRLVE